MLKKGTVLQLKYKMKTGCFLNNVAEYLKH